MRHFRKLLERGVTLVELALVLVIIGLMMGVYFSRAQNIAQEQHWIDAETELSAIREAVVLYASKNKTAQRRVEVFRADLTLIISADTLPGGRPILPCPDVNGDGIEDRQKEGAMPAVGATLTIIAPNPAALPPANRIVANNNPLLQFGNCVLQKGALPWRSLPGVFRATDPWGNLYTYRVDPNYSNRFIGFDENSRADSYDARLPWISVGDSVSPWPAKRAQDPGQMNIREWRRFFADAGDRLAIIPAMLTVNERASVICQRPPCPPRLGESNEMIAGMLATTGATLTTTQKFSEGAPAAKVLRSFTAPTTPLEEFEIIEGMPFVIVSHGREDRGAWLNHRKTANRGAHMAAPLNLLRASDVNNALDFGISQAPESAFLNFADLLGAGALVLVDPNIPLTARNWGSRFRGSAGAAGYVDNGFVQPRGVRVVDHAIAVETAQPAHDDVVVWMTTWELNQAAFRAGVLPVSPLPPFGVERN